MPRKLFIFPFGGNAREALLSVLALNELGAGWEVIGFLDDDPALHGRTCCGIRVVGDRSLLAAVPDAFVLAVPGSPQTFRQRSEILSGLGIHQERFATIIHPTVSRAPDARIGYNTVIMPNVVISCGVTIGNHCIILPNTVISHDSTVADYCCIGSNISISGTVSIGSGCYIGSGTKMRENIAVGAGTLVGLGASVISSLPADVIAAGTPAKILKAR